MSGAIEIEPRVYNDGCVEAPAPGELPTMWSAYRRDDDGCAIFVADFDREADALLFAAAQDLLAALEGLLTFAEDAETKILVGDEGCLWPVEAARAAISRATGEA